MPINLIDIRTAVQDYLNTKVGTVISALTPVVSGPINPGDEFSFKITALNAPAANGGIRLVNVRYHLKVVNPAIASLIVPGGGIALARSGSLTSDPVFAPGKLVPEMYLFPSPGDNKSLFPSPGDNRSSLFPSPGDNRSLEVDEHDFIDGLKGRATVVGNTQIQFDVIAEPDLDFLYPKNENSPLSGAGLTVV